MKKEYLAPAFTPVNMMIASAAGGCSVGVSNHGYQTCTILLPRTGDTIFGSPVVEECDYTPQEYGVFCYFTSGPNNTVFGS